MLVLQTERLLLRPFTTDDAPFVLTLLNEPSFLHFIGDKNVRSLEDARQYLLNGPIATYNQHDFGLLCIELRNSHTPIGMCGLLKREDLPAPDIGFAFLPDYWGRGFAFEAAAAVMKDARERLKLNQILAIVNPDNDASIKLLERLGLRFERVKGEVKLYALPDQPVE
jgi:RimJ/RimL family protein N-acetyltransferase